MAHPVRKLPSETPAAAAPEGSPALVSAPSRLNGGTMLGHYHLLRRIAAGGMGEVYLADDARLGRRVALKVLAPGLVDDPRQVSRFHHEALVAASLNDPHVLTVHDLGRADGVPYFVTEYVEGQTLRQRLRGGPLAPREAADAAAQVAAALEAVHRAGYVHRDVKPENLICRRDGLVKLIDFGICARVEPPRATPAGEAAGPSQSEGIIGTLEYLSPERARGLRVEPRSDLFSLGVVLYEMLTGHLPFPGTTAAERLDALVRCEPRPPSWLVGGIPDALVELVLRTLDRDPAARPSSAAMLQSLLRSLRLEAATAVVATRSGAPTPPGTEVDCATAPMRLPPAPPPQRGYWPLGASRRHRLEGTSSTPGTDPVLRAGGRVLR